MLPRKFQVGVLNSKKNAAETFQKQTNQSLQKPHELETFDFFAVDSEPDA